MNRIRVRFLFVFALLLPLTTTGCDEPKDLVDALKEWYNYVLEYAKEANDDCLEIIRDLEEQCLKRWKGDAEAEKQCKKMAQDRENEWGIAGWKNLVDQGNKICQDLAKNNPDWATKTNEQRAAIKKSAIDSLKDLFANIIKAITGAFTGLGEKTTGKATAAMVRDHLLGQDAMSQVMVTATAFPDMTNPGAWILDVQDAQVQFGISMEKVLPAFGSGFVLLQAEQTIDGTVDLTPTESQLQLSSLNLDAVDTGVNLFTQSKFSPGRGVLNPQTGQVSLTLELMVQNTFISPDVLFVALPLTGFWEGDFVFLEYVGPTPGLFFPKIPDPDLESISFGGVAQGKGHVAVMFGTQKWMVPTTAGMTGQVASMLLAEQISNSPLFVDKTFAIVDTMGVLTFIGYDLPPIRPIAYDAGLFAFTELGFAAGDSVPIRHCVPKGVIGNLLGTLD